MERLDLEAFITSSETRKRVQRLNEAVFARAILPIVGPRGAGKDRFLDWWVQEGCADIQFAEDARIKPEAIVFINAQPGPVSSVPVGCVVFTRLWRALQELERAPFNGETRRPLGRTRPCNESHVLGVIDDEVAPLLDQLLPQAIVIANAQHLDKTTLSYLLELRSPLRRTSPPLALRSLILCASTEDAAGEGSKFAKLLSNHGETSSLWKQRMVFPLLRGREFVEVMLELINQNLHAKVGDDVDEKQMHEDFAIWTGFNWWLVRELVIVLDRILGPRRDGQSRVITPKVLEQVRRTWVERSGGST